MGINTLDELAVKLQDHAQHAMGGRMLRTEIDREIPVLRRPRGLFHGCVCFHAAVSHRAVHLAVLSEPRLSQPRGHPIAFEEL